MESVSVDLMVAIITCQDHLVQGVMPDHPDQWVHAVRKESPDVMD